MSDSLFFFLRISPPSFYTRGGRVLWNCIRNDLHDKQVPETADELKIMFSASFEKLTNKK